MIDNGLKSWLIYGLVDPKSKLLRYVGKTRRGMMRPTSHWKKKDIREARDYCHNWIRMLLKENLVPEVVIIEEVIEHSNDSLNEREKFWIAFFRCLGSNLTNMTPGGDGQYLVGSANGMFGKKHSKETIEKLKSYSGEKKYWRFGKKDTDDVKMRRARHFMKKIRCIDDGMNFESIKAAASYYNVGRNSIGMACRGIYRYAYGRRFEFVEG